MLAFTYVGAGDFRLTETVTGDSGFKGRDCEGHSRKYLYE